MAKEPFLFAKLELDFADHPKIAILSDAAFRALVEAILHARKRQSDGLLARRYAVARWGADVLAELCANDDEKPSLIEVESGWQIHDYADINETKAEIEARRERNRAAGQKGGKAKANRAAKRTASRTAKHVASEPVSENVAETDIDISLDTDVSRESQHKRGTRLQDGWVPDRDVIDQMKSERPEIDLEAEHRKFVDYWKSKTGRDATKLDWNATWRNWIRNARTLSPVNGRNPSQGHDDKVNGYLAFANNTAREIEQ